MNAANDPKFMKNYLWYCWNFEKWVCIWQEAKEDAENKLQALQQKRVSAREEIKNISSEIDVYDTRVQLLLTDQKKKKKARKTLLLLTFAAMVIFVVVAVLANMDQFGDDPAVFIGCVLITVFSGFNLLFIPALIYLFFRIKNRGKERALTPQALESKKRREFAMYQEEIKDLSLIAHQCEVQEPAIRADLQRINAELKKALDNRSQCYSKNYVHQNFRGLIPTGVMYDYLASGVCTIVQGAGGIYDLYRREYREDKRHSQIMGQFKKANALLSEIRNDQSLLLQEVQQMNVTVNDIKSSVGRLEDTTAEIKNNTAISAAANIQSAAANQYTAFIAYRNSI